MSLLVDGAAWTALAAVIAMIVLALRRRLAVSRNQPSGAPLRWLASPGRAPMLHRRLRASVASVRSIVPPPSRRRGTSPWEADAAEVERLAAHLARELVRAARLPLVARHRALNPIATRVREHEAQARELIQLVARYDPVELDSDQWRERTDSLHTRLANLRAAGDELDRAEGLTVEPTAIERSPGVS
ncbi:MAG: hypothetical protein IPG46_08175 [Actinobacteria bacterium]|nr:hypothetical protein [Actinomycetota bacterium]